MRVDADDFARPCSCGREHQIAVKEILIEAGAVEKLEEEIRYCKHVGGHFCRCRCYDPGSIKRDPYIICKEFIRNRQISRNLL